MNPILFDDHLRSQFLPLAFTRPIADLRFGILKISEKWEKALNSEISYQTENYLSSKFPQTISSENLYINARYCPNSALISAIQSLDKNEVLKHGETIVAYILDMNSTLDISKMNTIPIHHRFVFQKSSCD